jgi:hypothetical protein
MGQILHALEVPTGPRPKEVIDASKLTKEVAGEMAKILGLEAVQPEPVSRDVNPQLAFVIMAFRPDMEPIFDGIGEAGAGLGLDVKRVKDLQGDYRRLPRTGIARTLYETWFPRPEFDTGRSVLLVFSFAFGFVGASGQLPQLILQGKVPGLKS